MQGVTVVGEGAPEAQNGVRAILVAEEERAVLRRIDERVGLAVRLEVAVLWSGSGCEGKIANGI